MLGQWSFLVPRFPFCWVGLGLFLGIGGMGLALWLESDPVDGNQAHLNKKEIESDAQVAEPLIDADKDERQESEKPDRESLAEVLRYREWTALDGRILRARSLGLWEEENIYVRLQRESDGQVFMIPLEQLRQVDRQFIVAHQAALVYLNRKGVADGPDGIAKVTGKNAWRWERLPQVRTYRWWPASATWIDAAVLRDDSMLILGYLAEEETILSRWPGRHWEQTETTSVGGATAGPFLLRTKPGGGSVDWVATWPKEALQPTALTVGRGGEILLTGRHGSETARFFGSREQSGWHASRDLLVRVSGDGKGWLWAEPGGRGNKLEGGPLIDPAGLYIYTITESWTGRDSARLKTRSLEDGHLRWQRRLAPEREGKAWGGRIAQVEEGGFFLGYHRIEETSSGRKKQAVIQRLDETGGKLWERRFPQSPSSSWIRIDDMRQCPLTGELVVIGRQRQEIIEEGWPGWLPGNPGDRKISWVGRFHSSSGELLGSWFYPATPEEGNSEWPILLESRIRMAAIDGRGNLYLTIIIEKENGEVQNRMQKHSPTGEWTEPLGHLPSPPEGEKRWLLLSRTGPWWMESDEDGRSALRGLPFSP